MVDEKRFYVGLKAFLKKGNQILILTSSDRAEIGLDFPGGKINQEETNLLEALKREVREETSLEVKVGTPFAVWTNDWSTSKYAKDEIFLVGYICDYVSGEVKLSSEHTDYRWIDKNTYQELNEGSNYYLAL